MFPTPLRKFERLGKSIFITSITNLTTRVHFKINRNIARGNTFLSYVLNNSWVHLKLIQNMNMNFPGTHLRQVVLRSFFFRLRSREKNALTQIKKKIKKMPNIYLKTCHLQRSYYPREKKSISSRKRSEKHGTVIESQIK